LLDSLLQEISDFKQWKETLLKVFIQAIFEFTGDFRISRSLSP